MRLPAAAVCLLATGMGGAHAEPENQKVPAEVAAAARTAALSGARPARLTTPMQGVRHEPFASSRMWVVDSERMNDSSLCGTGGCDVQFWLLRPDGRHAKIFDQRVLSYTIAGMATAQPVLRVDYHGSRCGEPGNAECSMAYRWVRDADAPAGRLVVEPADGGRGVLAGPLIAAVAPDRRRAPRMVAAALADLDQQCRARGGRSAATADELPDLNGDGRAEWATGGHAFFCSRGDRVIEAPCAGRQCPVMIFASGGGAVHRVYEATGVAYLLSYQATGVRLLVAPLGDRSVSASAADAKPLVFGTDGTAQIEP